MASLNSELLKSLGPAGDLLAIHDTTRNPSNHIVESANPQLPMQKGYSGMSDLDSFRMMSNQPSMKAEADQEPTSGISDSEDEDDAVPRPLNILERRKAQNSKFSAWCVLPKEMEAQGANAHRTEQVIKTRGQDYNGGSAGSS